MIIVIRSGLTTIKANLKKQQSKTLNKKIPRHEIEKINKKTTTKIRVTPS
jgi:hypothetical protein